MTFVLAPRSVMYFAHVASNTPIDRYSAAASASPDRTPRFATSTRSARFGCSAPIGGSSIRATAGEVSASAPARMRNGAWRPNSDESTAAIGGPEMKPADLDAGQSTERLAGLRSRPRHDDPTRRGDEHPRAEAEQQARADELPERTTRARTTASRPPRPRARPGAAGACTRGRRSGRDRPGRTRPERKLVPAIRPSPYVGRWYSVCSSASRAKIAP